MVKMLVTFIFNIGLEYKKNDVNIMDFDLWALVESWLLDS